MPSGVWPVSSAGLMIFLLVCIYSNPRAQQSKILGVECASLLEQTEGFMPFCLSVIY